MEKRIYIETTIPSYLSAKPGRDIIQLARQQLTLQWWNSERHNYELCISQVVVDEVKGGDKEAAQKRIEMIADLPLLDLTLDVDRLAENIIQSKLLPDAAFRDAIHIAVSCVHSIDFLLTWNCKHIANATILKDLHHLIMKAGYELPVICTPEELIGD